MILAAAATDCGGGGDSPSSPSSPSALPSPPAATANVFYTAIGASDANGVGGSMPCVPFSA